MTFKNLLWTTTALFAVSLSAFYGCSKFPSGVLNTNTVAATSPAASPSSTPGTKTKKVSVVAPDPDRTVYIVGEIGSNALDIAAQITKLGQQDKTKPIYVVETSPGGSVLTGGQVIAAIESSPAPVYTVCHVLCASMAAMIFEYGNKRYIGDRSFVMFHPAAGGADGELDKMISRLLSMQRYIGKMEAYVGSKAALTFDQYKAKASVEAWIDGEDAVNGGFADETATVSLPANSPYSGLFGAQLLYQGIYSHQDPIITTSPRVYKENPADFKWIVTPSDLKWLGSFNK